MTQHGVMDKHIHRKHNFSSLGSVIEALVETTNLQTNKKKNNKKKIIIKKK